MILALSTVFTLALLPALELTSSRTSVLAADVRLLGFQLRFPSDGAVFEYMNGTAALAAGVDPADIEAAGDDAESFIVAHGVCTVSLLLGNFEDKDRSVRSVEIEGQLRNLRMPSTATNTDDLVRFGRTEIFDINLPGRANTTLDFDLPMAFRLQVSDEMTLRRERIVAQPSRAAVRHLARKVTNVAKNGGSNGVAARIASSDAEYAASTELMSALNGTGMLHAHNLHNCMDDASQNATATDTVNKMNYTPLTLSTRQWSRWLLIHQLRNANQCLFINSADITGNSGPLRPMPVQEAARLGTSVLGFRATVHVSGFLDAIGYMPIVTGQLLSYCPTSDHAVDA